MPNSTMQTIRSLRPDLSDYFFHFTKGENGRDTLKQIIEDSAVKDINKRGYISVTETPILSMIDLLLFFDDTYHSPMFAPYGVAIKRNERLEGLRSAIYGPNSERDLYDEKVLWRYIDVSEDYDNTWFREWRCRCNEIELDPESDFIIFKSINEKYEFIVNDIDVDVDPGCREGDASMTVSTKQGWRGISIEELVKTNIKNSDQIEALLRNQPLNEWI